MCFEPHSRGSKLVKSCKLLVASVILLGSLGIVWVGADGDIEVACATSNMFRF